MTGTPMTGTPMTETQSTTPRARLVAQAYLDAWNAQDGPGVLATFAPDGTYVDPTLPGPIGGEHLAGYVGGLAAAFPDLHFAVEDVAVVPGDRVFVGWQMRGTNAGPLPGAPQPTGGTCDLPGIDVITVADGGIASVVRYFDQKTFVEQLGLQALVAPADEEPMVWGVAARTAIPNPTLPGALSMTWADVDTPAQMAEIQVRTQAILEGFAAEPGFITWLGSITGMRMHTVTAWTSAEAAESAIARSPAHREAVERVHHGDLVPRGFTSIWVPHRLNQRQSDCPQCGTKVWWDPGTTPRCACGHEPFVTAYL